MTYMRGLSSEDQVNILFDTFTGLFHRGAYLEANDLIEGIDIGALDERVAIGLLDATRPADDRMPGRLEAKRKVMKRLLELLDPECVEGVMRALR